MAKELKFNFEQNSTVQNGRNQIRYTAQLNAISDQRANEALRAASQDADLFEIANNVLDSGDASQLFSFLDQTVGHYLAEDAQFMSDATEQELDSMLESRRSDRSKTKAKGLKSSAAIAQKYLSTGYAEQLVRHVWNKPYDAAQSNIELDTEDVDAINRKIKSLQSKKSRLSKLVKYDSDAQRQYDEVVAEIDRLASFRPETRSTSKTVLKDAIDTDVLRAALTQVDKTALDAEQLAKLEDLMKKLG